MNRRKFFQKSGSAALLAAVPAWARGTDMDSGLIKELASKKIAANDRIGVAVLGFGMRGLDDLKTLYRYKGIELIGAADVYDGRLIRAKELYGNQVFTSRYHEEVLKLPNVDAVIIAGTHHWNAQMIKDSLAAGKSVYVEKPMVNQISEGKPVIEAAKKSGKTLLVGSQRVSNLLYAKAKELYEQGAIGELNYVEAWWDRNSITGAWQYAIAPDASEKNCDWKRFLGNAPQIPFDSNRLFRWRNYKDYGTGVAGDLFVHLFSGLHYILGSDGPKRVFSTGGIRYWKDGRDVPDVLLGVYDYEQQGKNHPAFNLFLRVNFIDGGGGSTGFRFVGSEGVMSLDRTLSVKKFKRPQPYWNIETFPKAVQEQFMKDYREKYPDKAPELSDVGGMEFKAPDNYNDLYDHLGVFVDAIRNGKSVIEDANFGFKACAPAILTQESFFQNKPLYWDVKNLNQTSK